MGKSFHQQSPEIVILAEIDRGIHRFHSLFFQPAFRGIEQHIGRLLVVDAPLWILDEPFTSLDVHGIGLIEGLLEDHTRNGGMLAMTSHHTVNLVNTPVHHINLSS